LLLEKSEEGGGGDHTTLMIHKFFLHEDCMSRKLEIDEGYRVCPSSFGRGLESMVRVEIGGIIDRYDGHRVDMNGKVVIRREHISQLMQRYPEIDREKNNTPWKDTHAIRLAGQTKKRSASWGSHESGLLVDGGPLTHPCLDHVKGIGRLALADSGSPQESNM
jgi:hypothetical protein